MDKIFYAKSPLGDGRQPTVAEHLRGVAELAGKFGKDVRMPEAAYLAGQFHDFGKYSDAFQRVLRREESRIDHAVGGAVAVYSLGRKQRMYSPVVEAINGHHDGLVSLPWLEETLRACAQDENAQGNDGKKAALSGKSAFAEAMRAFRRDFSEFCGLSDVEKEEDPKAETGDMAAVSSMLRTRMLFSCLVDADYSASAMDENPQYLKETEKSPLDAQKTLERLYEYLKCLRCASNAAAGVDKLRQELFERCGAMGEEASGLYTLTAPTGTGKTLAMLHFALRHCRRWGMKRIIAVLPYLTLTEQSAGVYRQIMGEVFEDHSQVEITDEARMFSQRWSVPFVLTTSVRFFESLFSARPPECRKLHHIAGSVILFDEVQSLPPELMRATLTAVKRLCDTYGCTMLFSSATQPAFEALPEMAWEPRPIIPNPKPMYEALKRTNIKWNIENPLELEYIANEMAEKNSVCTIVNLRRHARRLFEMLKERSPLDSIFMLSTDLCPAHRKRVIEEIRIRLKEGRPCRVVATQCIEAGVDLDFDALYRALAPLDGIIQAAGRCNRNGRLKNGGWVTVFVPAEEGILYPDDWYSNAANLVKKMYMQHGIDIQSPEDIRQYYEELLTHVEDKRKLVKALREQDYAGVEKQYRLIPDRGFKVIVPDAGERKLFDQIEEAYQAEGLSMKLIQMAAPIMVTVYAKTDDIETFAEQLLYSTRRGSNAGRSDVFILRKQYHDCYTEDSGLDICNKHKLCILC